MEFPFGAELTLPVRFFLAFIIVLVLIGATAFLVRRFGSSRLGGGTARGRQPRLAVIDAAAVDGRRRLILIRRDNVEHLLMIGGPSDVVVEANILRGVAPARDTGPQRPAAAPADTLPRPVPLGEGNMWPLQPEPAPPPRPRVMDEPVQWHAEPEPVPPPPRRAEPRALEPRPSEPRPSEPRPADPLAGLAAELSRVQPDASKPRAPREFARPERTRPAPVTAAAPADETPAPSADQNLAEMAQRLEAALRRPKPSAPESIPTSAPAMDSKAGPSAAPGKAESKSVYDSLEQEMASLLGRPNNKT